MPLCYNGNCVMEQLLFHCQLVFVHRFLCNIFGECFVTSYVGAFFHLTAVLIDLLSLCRFIVVWKLGAVGFIFMYFHMFSFGMILLHCSVMCFVIYWYR
jgi:hypothetical protein